jgi:hypothetical protein
MNMRTFYRQLAVKPADESRRRLAGLTRLSRAQILKATSQITWYIWNAEASNA